MSHATGVRYQGGRTMNVYVAGSLNVAAPWTEGATEFEKTNTRNVVRSVGILRRFIMRTDDMLVACGRGFNAWPANAIALVVRAYNTWLNPKRSCKAMSINRRSGPDLSGAVPAEA